MGILRYGKGKILPRNSCLANLGEMFFSFNESYKIVLIFHVVHKLRDWY